MIMVLSCFDLLVVITNHPLLILGLMLWLKQKNDLLAMVETYEHFTDLFIGFSLIALLVMSIERYLGAYYPLFHRTSLTRRKLLILLAVLSLVPVLLVIISANHLVISFATGLLVFVVIIFPPFVFFNYKLFMISRKVRRDIARGSENSTSPEVNALHVSLKNISTCLFAVGFLLLMYIPAFSFIAFNFAEKSTSDSTKMANIWTSTIANANSTLNCLIFFWKNDVLRKEGRKTVKALKDRLIFAC